MRGALPHLIAGSGSVILTSSVRGLRGAASSVHYSTVKHGVVGIMRSLAGEFAGDRIRVNSTPARCMIVKPGSVPNLVMVTGRVLCVLCAVLRVLLLVSAGLRGVAA